MGDSFCLLSQGLHARNTSGFANEFAVSRETLEDVIWNVRELTISGSATFDGRNTDEDIVEYSGTFEFGGVSDVETAELWPNTGAGSSPMRFPKKTFLSSVSLSGSFEVDIEGSGGASSYKASAGITIKREWRREDSTGTLYLSATITGGLSSEPFPVIAHPSNPDYAVTFLGESITDPDVIFSTYPLKTLDLTIAATERWTNQAGAREIR
jgi:hypothetical protein